MTHYTGFATQTARHTPAETKLNHGVGKKPNKVVNSVLMTHCSTIIATKIYTQVKPEALLMAIE